jgi:hypothetical protein
MLLLADRHGRQDHRQGQKVAGYLLEASEQAIKFAAASSQSAAPTAA